MKSVSPVAKFARHVAYTVTLIVATAMVTQAQNSIPVFPSSVTVRLSINGTSNDNPNIFGTSTQNVTCPASGIAATVSSTADGTAKVLVDNYLNLTLAQDGKITGPVNLCSGGVSESGYNDCFTTAYQTPAGNGELTGDDPNGAITASGGIGPINISSLLVPGLNTLRFEEVDTGGYFAASSIYLDTNCTSAGTSGGGTITGTPISSTNPTPQELTQDFTFSGTTDKVVGFVYDLSKANSEGTLNITNQATPTVVDAALDPALWPSYVSGTSFATSQCLIHLGELFGDPLAPACKLYTLTCQIGQDSNGSGVQCPSSTERNIVVQDVFDFPALSLPDITVIVKGQTELHKATFHQGFGLLEASEGWTGGPCTFDPGAGQLFSCPENLLTLFEGPGLGRGTGTPSPSVNSSFVSVGPVPEVCTEIFYKYFDEPNWVDSSNLKWVNSRDVNVRFRSTPPIVPPPNNDFVAAPVYSITYGVTPADAVPPTEFPVKDDKTLLNPHSCPGTLPANVFEPAPVKVSVSEDGKYSLHYFATDCAGTQSLHFYEDASEVWHTKFYTTNLNVDTVAPTVAAGPTLSPAPAPIGGTLAYCRNQAVTASFQCADDRSGVEWCRGHHYSNPITDPGALHTTVDTKTLGAKVFTVRARDAAQNVSAPASVPYTVVECPAP